MKDKTTPLSAVAVDPLVRRLRAMARHEHDDFSIGNEAADRITELEDMLFELGAMEEAPCFCCGYNGPGYFQPGTQKCAERHHMPKKDSYE